MNNKKTKSFTLATILVLVMLISAFFTGCSGVEPAENSSKVAVAEALDAPVSEPIKIAALNGPTGMGLAPLIGDERFNITIYQSPDEITGKIVSGEVDIAAVPSNLAAVLYNKTDGGIKVLSTITMGVLYIVEDGETLTDFSQLNGKTVYGSGQGGVPEYVMNYLASAYDISINMEWLGTHADVAAKLTADGNAAAQAGKKSSGSIALLPEPQVSILDAPSPGEQYNVLDINAVWKEKTDEELPMGVLVAQKSFTENRVEDLDTFMKNAMDSVGKVHLASFNYNSDDIALKESAQQVLDALIDNGFFNAKEVAVCAIPNCNIVLYHGDDSYKSGLNALYQLLYENNPKSVGGTLPGDDLYL